MILLAAALSALTSALIGWITGWWIPAFIAGGVWFVVLIPVLSIMNAIIERGLAWISGQFVSPRR